MGLQCKICNTELDAFSGGRCRHCRQLVCSECIAQGAPNSPGGLLCKDCASHQIEQPQGLPPVVIARRRFRVPAWTWGLFATVLAGVFLLIVVKPYIDDSAMVDVVIRGTDEEYFAVLDELAKRGGNHALELLTDYVKTTADPVRARAARALGALPGDKPLQRLQQLRDAPDTPASLKSILYEAVLEHTYRHPVGAADASGQVLPPPDGRAVPIPVPANAPSR